MSSEIPAPIVSDQAIQVSDEFRHARQKLPEGWLYSVFGNYEVAGQERDLHDLLHHGLVHEMGKQAAQEDEQRIRDDIASFIDVPEIDTRVSVYFDTLPETPPIFRDYKAMAEHETGRELTWCDWLANESTSAQLWNFMDWHNFRHRQMKTSPETAQMIQAEKADYILRANRFKSTGLLHKEFSLDSEALDNVEVHIQDIFHSFMIGGSEGFTTLDGTSVDIIEDYDPAVLTHEFTHATMTGFGEYLQDTWLNEALTEHIAQAMRSGNVLVVDPTKREKGSGYEPERQLLATVLEGGKVPVELEFFTQHYSARSASERELTLSELKSQIEEAWGDREMIAKLSVCISAMPEESYDEYEREMQSLIQDPSVVLTVA